MTTEELEQIRKIVREENEPLKQGQARLEKDHLQHKTALEAIAAGQKELQGDVKEIRGTMATKADVQDLRADLGNKFKKLTERVEAVEEIEGIPNPHKH